MEKYLSPEEAFLEGWKESTQEIEKTAEESSEEEVFVKVAEQSISTNISAIKLFDMLMEKYQTEWFEWLPEVIRKTVLDGQENEVIENKIQALATCCSTDTPWLEWHIFENVAKAFNHQVPVFGIFQPLSLGECIVAYKVMEYMRDENWSNEVMIYMATCAYTNNLVYVPETWLPKEVQAHIDGFGNDLSLKMKVIDGWDKIEHVDVLDKEFRETAEQIQLGRLNVVQQYIKENV